MRTTITVGAVLLVTLLIVMMAEIGGQIPASLRPWEIWLLRSAVVFLFIGVSLAGRRMQKLSIQQQAELEAQVVIRTEELQAANLRLEEEIIQRKRAEAALAKQSADELSVSNARFRAIFNDAAVGMGIMGLDRRIIDANPAICRLYGMTREELIGMNAAEVTLPEDNPEATHLFNELVAGQSDSYEMDRRYIRKNGEVFWAHVTMSSVRGSDNMPRFLVGMVIDVDKQKRDALALQESEARFRAMFDSAAIGIGMMDLNRVVIRGNLQARSLLGYSEDELKYLDVIEHTHPDDRLIDQELFSELVSGKRDSYQIEKRYRHKDGHWVWARSTLSAVQDTQGHALYILALVEDISEYKQTLAKLHESEARFRAMFDNAAVGMALMSTDRKVLQINQAAEHITGYPLSELVNINPSMLAHPDDRYLDREIFEGLVNGEINHYQTDKRYIQKNGALFWGRLTYTSVRNGSKSPEYIIGMLEDITEQKRTAERLAEQEAEYLLTLQQSIENRTHELEETNQRLHKEIEQRLKIEDELATKAANEAVTADRTRLARDLHDAVTQTLFSASLTAEVLPDLWDMDVDEAKKSTEELRQLTRGALAEMRTLLLELRPATLTQTHLSDLIKQLCEAFIGRSRLPIVLNIEGDCPLPPEVQVAFYRIAQESLNNVFKYARAAQVNVSLFISKSSAHFETCDNGIGFDMSASKPTSLGMRIMRERAEAIGAELQVSSELGRGTCVAVTWQENPNHKLRVL
jgi:PAS domain S-box-containing protein